MGRAASAATRSTLRVATAVGSRTQRLPLRAMRVSAFGPWSGLKSQFTEPSTPELEEGLDRARRFQQDQRVDATESVHQSALAH